MNMQIKKKIKFLILLKLIIYVYLIILFYNKQINELESSQNYQNKIKTFEFILENQLNNQIKRKINLDYKYINFAVIKRAKGPGCGLFSNYYNIFFIFDRQFIWCLFITSNELDERK
jgi:hypothetical protein